MFVSHRRLTTIRDLPLDRLGEEITLAQLKERCDTADADPDLAEVGVGAHLREIATEIETLLETDDVIRWFSGTNIGGLAIVRNGAVHQAFVTVMT